MLLVLLLLALFLLSGAFFFVRSSQFPRFVGQFISNRSGKTVEIGSITFLSARKLLVQDLTVRHRDGTSPLLVLPSTEISISLAGIMSKTVEAVVLENPRAIVDLNGQKSREGVRKFTLPPFRPQHVKVTGGEAVFRSHGDTAFRVSSIDLNMRESSSHRASLAGSMYLNELGISVPFTTEVDLKKIDISRGHIDVFFENLGELPLQDRALFRKVNMKGAARFAIDMSRNDDISIRIEGHLTGMGFQRDGQTLLPDNSSGQVRALLAVHKDFGAAELTMEADLLSPYRGKEYSHRLTLHGGYDVAGRAVTVEKAIVQSSLLGTVKLEGSIDDLLSSNPSLDISVAVSEVPFKNIQNLLSEHPLAKIDTVIAHGSVRADLSVTGTFKEPHALGIFSVTLEDMNTNTISLTTARARIPFEYSSGTVSIREANMAAADIVYLPDGQGGNAGFHAENCALRMSHVEIRDSLARSGTFVLNADRAVIYRKGKERFSDTGITLEGVFKGSRNQQRLQVGHISSASGLMEGFSGSIDVSLGSPVSIKTVFTGEKIDLRTMVREVPIHEKLRELSVQGEASLRFDSEITVPHGRALRVTGTVDATILNGSFSSPEFTKVAEGITMNSSVEFAFALPLQTVEFSLDVQAGGYELLWGRFYGDFKDRDTILSLHGKYSGELNTFIVSDSALTMKNMGTVRMSGEIADIPGSARMAADVVLDDIVNKEVFDFFIRETFQEKFGFLSEIAIGGVTSGKVSVKGSKERFAVAGAIDIRDMYLSDKETGFAAQGVHVSLPVDMLYPDIRYEDNARRFGLLKARSVTFAGIHMEDLTFYPRIWKNTLVFREDIDVPVFGGSIRLRDFRYKDLLSPGRKLTLSLEIDDIDLREMSTTLDLPVLSGSLTGFIPEAVLSGQRFSTQGRITVQAFGGEVIVDNLTIHNIFGPVASVKTSIGIHDLYLDKLTETFEFGHISGVVRGYVKDLVITNGQAERFEAALESVKTKGASQWISVEALKKISILGSGTSASVLNQGIYRFFEKYQYEKMGFRGTLKNDTLRLLGVEALGNRWYLVKGGLIPPRVDVISYNQNISFQEMLRRLMRVRSVKEKR
jgi:hypothetical protein